LQLPSLKRWIMVKARAMTRDFSARFTRRSSEPALPNVNDGSGDFFGCSGSPSTIPYESLAVISVHDPEEQALRRRYEDRLHASSLHPLDKISQFLAGPNGRGTELHELFHSYPILLWQIRPSHPSEDDPRFIRDCANRVSARLEFGSNLFRERVRPTGRRRRTEDLASEEQEGTGPFGRETALDPCRLATNEVMRPLEPKLFEPPRGPWAHVSEVVVTVGDDRLRSIEVNYRLRRQLFQRNVAGTR
jgi:hypothetical protein